MSGDRVSFDKTLGPCGQPSAEAEMSSGLIYVVCPAHTRTERLLLPGTEGTVSERLGVLCVGCAMNPNLGSGTTNLPDSMEA